MGSVCLFFFLKLVFVISIDLLHQSSQLSGSLKVKGVLVSQNWEVSISSKLLLLSKFKQLKHGCGCVEMIDDTFATTCTL